MTDVRITPPDPKAPWGWRGQRPIRVFVGRDTAKALRDERIPGLEAPPTGWLSFAWDLAPTMGRVLGLSESVLPRAPALVRVAASQFPTHGVDAWKRLKATARAHHPAGVGFLASRAWASCWDDMRTGKTFQSIAVTELWASARTLYVTKPDLKANLAREIVKWTGRRVLILEGRAGDEARDFCLACLGWGSVEDKPCTACNGFGDVARTVRDQGKLSPITITADALDDAWGAFPEDLDDGTPEGAQAAAAREWYLSHIGDYSFINAYLGCRDHIPGKGYRRQRKNPNGQCTACVARFRDLLRSTPYVVGNYDIFQVHRQKTILNERVNRTDLRGWAPVMAEIYKPEMAWLDEAWKIRTYDEKSIGRWQKTDQGFTFVKGHGLARPQQIALALKNTVRAYVLNGTPTYAANIDLWQPLDVISGGLFGDTPKNFGARYCGGHYETIYNTWVDTGSDPRIDSEFWAERAPTFAIRREMHEVTDMPVTQHQVIVVEPPTYAAPKRDKWGALTPAALEKHLDSLTPHKIETIVEAVLSEMVQGKRTFVLARNIDTIRAIGKALEVAMQATTNRVRMRAVSGRIWVVCDSANTPNFEKFRNASVREFVTHKGAGAYLSTYSAAEGGFGLPGAVSCHSADFAQTPGQAWQAMRRPLEIGSSAQTAGYTVYHYVLARSLDADVSRLFIPKLEAIMRAKTADATQLRQALADATETKKVKDNQSSTDDDLYAIMAAHLAMVGDGDVSNSDDEDEDSDE